MKKINLSDKDLQSLVTSALDVHCHGVGRFDFTEINGIKFREIEEVLACKSHSSVLTLYLPEENFQQFLQLMEIFAEGKSIGLYPHIRGIALEGPLLASHGGTPRKTVWHPSKTQWQQLAHCGKLGLLYVIWSPDSPLLSHGGNDIQWITETLLKGGVLSAAGHFLKNNPSASAHALQLSYDVFQYWGVTTITDHLYNDMPLNFIHAWRTKKAKATRKTDLDNMALESWNGDNFAEKLGPVPAVMLENAMRGNVKIAINCDGEHVDLQVLKRTFEIFGVENFLMMTDCIESKRLAGRELTMKPDSTLLYQSEGIVAAGSQGVIRQIRNLASISLSYEEIQLICGKNSRNLFDQHDDFHRTKYWFDIESDPTFSMNRNHSTLKKITA